MIRLPPKTDVDIERMLGLPQAKIIAFCQHWQISELAAFGSILREDFRPDSDIDLLIQFAPQAPQGLLTLAKIKHALEACSNRKIDIAIKESVQNSPNPFRRDEILNTTQVIYAQR
ncbi:MAG: nucleotidyltransferase family protein [Cyanobacteriota bacterium]